MKLKEPTFDGDNYPTYETEEAIRTWPVTDLPGLMEFLKAAWNTYDGKFSALGDSLHLVTGGWSGNESLIDALQDNYLAWGKLWQSSHRGGLTVLKLP